MKKGNEYLLLLWLLVGVDVTCSAWIDSPRYGAGYTQFETTDDLTRKIRCAPCDEHRSNSIDDLGYRGNGADNLGYDWSPKAWGGLAFRNKAKDEPESDIDWIRGRDSRKMPGNWDEPKCKTCGEGFRRPNEDWIQDRPRDYNDPNSWNRDKGKPGSWDSTTSRPNEWFKPTQHPFEGEGTVTSPVLGVMYRNDKRLPVEWSPEGGRTMRWDGFRNGVSWDEPMKMDRRSSWDGPPDPYDEHDKRYSGWDEGGKGHYASNWNYGSPSDREWSGSGSKWNTDRPWNHQSGDPNRSTDNRAYPSSSSGNLPFGSSYPQQNRPPTNTGYPTERPYPSNSWSSSSTSSYPSNHYHYPTNNYPTQTSTHRPYPNDRPGYPTTPSQYYPQRPNQGGLYRPNENGPWNYPSNYDKNRPNQWTTPKPSQSYLPQTGRPPSRPDYNYEPEQRPNRPYGGTPSITIWNTRPNEYNPRPEHPGSKPPKGTYTGFITEIRDPNQNHYGSKFPNEPPPYGGSNNDRYPGNFPGGSSYPNDKNKYPSSNNNYPHDRPSYNQDQRPGYDSNRFPDRGPSYGDRFPNQRPDYERPHTSDRYPPAGWDNRYPNTNKEYDRFPNNNGYPNQEKDRYPTNDRDRYPNYNNDRYPTRPGNSDHDRYPNRPGYNDDRYPSNDNKYPNKNDYDRYPDRPGSGHDHDRYPSRPGSDHDRYPNRPSSNDYDRNPNRPGNNNQDRYPSRPGSNDHDTGPNPGNDSGSWNYGDDDHKDGTYRRSGGSYPPYKGGNYFTSSYLASASTPSPSSQEVDTKNKTDETTVATSQEN